MSWYKKISYFNFVLTGYVLPVIHTYSLIMQIFVGTYDINICSSVLPYVKLPCAYTRLFIFIQVFIKRWVLRLDKFDNDLIMMMELLTNYPGLP